METRVAYSRGNLRNCLQKKTCLEHIVIIYEKRSSLCYPLVISQKMEQRPTSEKARIFSRFTSVQFKLVLCLSKSNRWRSIAYRRFLQANHRPLAFVKALVVSTAIEKPLLLPWILQCASLISGLHYWPCMASNLSEKTSAQLSLVGWSRLPLSR